MKSGLFLNRNVAPKITKNLDKENNFSDENVYTVEMMILTFKVP